MLQFLRVKGCPRMTSPGAGDLQSKSRSKANFSSFWSRSGARRRRASLMLKFRKNELFWLKSQYFRCANSRKRQFQNLDFPGEKGSKVLLNLSSNASFLCTSSSGARPMCYWRKHKKIQCLRTVESSSRGWKKAIFRDKISEFRAVEGR